MAFRIFSRRAGLAALSALLVPAAAARAQPASISDQAPTVIVRYDDLDLRSEAGAAKLRARVRRAASMLYDSRSIGELARRAIVMRAEQEALARSQLQVEAAIRSVRESVARSSAPSS